MDSNHRGAMHNRVTACHLQPLGHLPLNWLQETDSNGHIAAYETTFLPIEISCINSLADARLELTTPCANRLLILRATGVEPVSNWLEASRLTVRPNPHISGTVGIEPTSDTLTEWRITVMLHAIILVLDTYHDLVDQIQNYLSQNEVQSPLIHMPHLHLYPQPGCET